MVDKFVSDILKNHELYNRKFQSKNPIVQSKAGRYRIKRNQIIKKFAEYCILNNLDCKKYYEIFQQQAENIPDDESESVGVIFMQEVNEQKSIEKNNDENEGYETDMEDMLFTEGYETNNLPRFIKNTIRVIKKDPTSRGRLINQLAQQVKEYNSKLETKMLKPEEISSLLDDEELSRIFMDKFEKIQDSDDYDEMLFEEIKKEIKFFLFENENVTNEEELIGKHIWVHTNRTRNNVGIYNSSPSGRKIGNPIGYVNSVLLEKPIFFQYSKKSAERIVQSKKRTLIAGISGVCLEVDGELPSGFVDATYTPNVGYFYIKNNPNVKITDADNIFLAYNSGWILKVKNPKTTTDIPNYEKSGI